MNRIILLSIILLSIISYSCNDDTIIDETKTINDYIGIHSMNCKKTGGLYDPNFSSTYQTELEIRVQNDSLWIIEDSSYTNTPLLDTPYPPTEIDNELNYSQLNGANYFYDLKIDLITDSIFLTKRIQFNSSGTTWEFEGKKE